MQDDQTKKNTPAQDDDLVWELLKEEHLIRNEWIDFRQSTFRLPDGTVFSPYYSYSRRSYVVVVAADENGDLICVRQFRHGIRQVTTEFPAGGIERSTEKQYADGDKDATTAEDALESAKRELAEETGYASDDWTHLLTIPSNATIADNYAHLFLAKNCRRTGDLHLDALEFLRVKTFSPNEIDDLIETGRFQQAMHVLAWELARKNFIN